MHALYKNYKTLTVDGYAHPAQDMHKPSLIKQFKSKADMDEWCEQHAKSLASKTPIHGLPIECKIREYGWR